MTEQIVCLHHPLRACRPDQPPHGFEMATAFAPLQEFSSIDQVDPLRVGPCGLLHRFRNRHRGEEQDFVDAVHVEGRGEEPTDGGDVEGAIGCGGMALNGDDAGTSRAAIMSMPPSAEVKLAPRIAHWSRRRSPFAAVLNASGAMIGAGVSVGGSSVQTRWSPAWTGPGASSSWSSLSGEVGWAMLGAGGPSEGGISAW